MLYPLIVAPGRAVCVQYRLSLEVAALHVPERRLRGSHSRLFKALRAEGQRGDLLSASRSATNWSNGIAPSSPLSRERTETDPPSASFGPTMSM